MKLLKNIFNALLEARTAKAEVEVAMMLQRTEYRGESFEKVLEMVREKKLAYD